MMFKAFNRWLDKPMPGLEKSVERSKTYCNDVVKDATKLVKKCKKDIKIKTKELVDKCKEEIETQAKEKIKELLNKNQENNTSTLEKLRPSELSPVAPVVIKKSSGIDANTILQTPHDEISVPHYSPYLDGNSDYISTPKQTYAYTEIITREEIQALGCTNINSLVPLIKQRGYHTGSIKAEQNPNTLDVKVTITTQTPRRIPSSGYSYRTVSRGPR